MADTLKKKTGVALIWSFIDKGGQQLIQLVFMLVLARLLSTDDFGVIAVLGIFTAVAGLLQESGFSSALIRKKEVKHEEYSSVFYFNISISILIYLLLFLVAPYISAYYEKPILTNLSRFIFLAFLFNSFGIIQNVNLVRRMEFKTNARITLIAGLASGIIAITLAFRGYGAWALAAQLVIQSFLRNLLLWIFVRWTPSSRFTIKPIKAMFSYSSKLLMASFMNQICSNIYANIIGKQFSLSQAGIYDRSNKLNMIPQSVISDGINSVTSPLLASIDDEERRIRIFRKVMRIASFISFPISLILIIAAKPIVILALSDKWLDVVPILQILAVGGSVFPLFCLHGRMLQYKGKSGQFFIMELVKNSLLLISILISIRYGVLGLVSGISIVQIIAFISASFIVSRIVDYGVFKVLTDIVPYLLAALVAYIPFYWLNTVIENNFLLFVCQALGGSLLYLTLIKLFGSQVLNDCINFAKGKNNE